jgi:hypothetical protein
MPCFAIGVYLWWRLAGYRSYFSWNMLDRGAEEAVLNEVPYLEERKKTIPLIFLV